ncbi:hypothetical protein M427DRAFT_248158 [Gonapodya prolifera JEL478]|uniref:Centromere protein J C-terminal domain-containing protein n=1 Tax=Gonapodya prolifera (strain JEL478) TaxID=1344416 RepID=A0A138ZXH6_GONPJ|nr:hypothetical protein M427DRAFT_248158 [Gonapodya prolifera JEL478]|eukprot:KXS09212.1 hypothetical protein M427DRAFT_248158 [Gonapodya prolifera JEL478]
MFPGLAREHQRRYGGTEAKESDAVELPPAVAPVQLTRTRAPLNMHPASVVADASTATANGKYATLLMEDFENMGSVELKTFVTTKLADLDRQVFRFKRAAEDMERARKEAEERGRSAKEEEGALRRHRAELDAQRAQLAAERRDFKRDKTKWEKQRQAAEVLPTKSDIATLQSQVTHLTSALHQAKLRASLDRDRLERRCEDLTKRNAELVDEVRALERERASWLEREKSKPLQNGTTPPSAKSKTQSTLRIAPLASVAGGDHGSTSLNGGRHTPEQGRSASEPRTAAVKAAPVGARAATSTTRTIKRPISGSTSSELGGAAPAAEGRQANPLTSPGVHKADLAAGSALPSASSDVTDRLDALERNLGLAVSFLSEYVLEGGGVRRTYQDGTVLEARKGGVVKETRRDGRVVVRYGNGDTRETVPGDRETYVYAATRTQVTTYADGRRVCVFENGQTEYRWSDGSECIVYTDGTKKYIGPSGEEELEYPDGTRAGNLSQGLAIQWGQQN